MLNKVGLAFGCLLGLSSANVRSHTETTIASSCTSLPDGDHWLKFIDGDEYPPVYLTCSNGYAILDLQKDPNLEQYFSSFEYWHIGIAGPSNVDHANWKHWFKPASYDTDTTKFLVSPKCDVCDATDTSVGANELDTDTAYHMTGNLFGCYWALKGLHNCDMDDDYKCYTCQQLKPRTMISYVADEGVGTCVTLLRSADSEVPIDHDECGSGQDHSYKPSLGTQGKFCACVGLSEETTYTSVDITYLEEAAQNLRDTKKSKHEASISLSADKTNDNNELFELYQSDFDSGTYRITKSGTYTIMEDIEFDFNAGTSNEDGAWLPHEDQSDIYPGAGSYRDPYFLGFFAGITVEADNVIINLNGHELRQSKKFFIQQRWFSIIELSNQAFNPGQGPGFFGSDLVKIENLEIYGGTLGLTSHHGIHGNSVTNVNIHDVVIKNFETHGIQINGFDNLILKDLEIMESATNAFLKANYFHSRMTLPRLRLVLNENIDDDNDDNNYIQFYGRDEPTYLGDIISTLEIELDLVFDYVSNYKMEGKDESEFLATLSDEEKELWVNEAKDVFVNDGGIPYGSSMYGIFLNSGGTSVFSMSQSTITDTKSVSTDGLLENIKIHGFQHQMEEIIRFHQSAVFLVNPYAAVIDASKAMEDVDDIENTHYKGDIITDMYIAFNEMTEHFGYLQLQHFQDYFQGGISDWARGDTNLVDVGVSIACNSDSMTHSGKGIFGVRIEGATGMQLKNVEIYDLYDYTSVGSYSCGNYEMFSDFQGGHFQQKVPTQVGFTGNQVQGISISAAQIDVMDDIVVRDMGSATGLTYGMSVWETGQVDFSGKFDISNLNAGFNLDKDTYTYQDRPNRAPEACGVRIYWEYDDNKPTIVDGGNINVECIHGHTGCFDVSDFGATTLGNQNFDTSSCADSNIIGQESVTMDMDSSQTYFEQKDDLITESLYMDTNTVASKSMFNNLDTNWLYGGVGLFLIASVAYYYSRQSGKGKSIINSESESLLRYGTI